MNIYLESVNLDEIRNAAAAGLAVVSAVAAQVLYGARADWALSRRGVDFYPESELLWLEADGSTKFNLPGGLPIVLKLGDTTLSREKNLSTSQREEVVVLTDKAERLERGAGRRCPRRPTRP